MLSKRFINAAQMISAPARGHYKAAVLLAGNGVYDGTETTEAVALLVGLSRRDIQVQCFAPDRDQAHVVDHTSGQEEQHPRNVLKESARIARGNVLDIAQLKAADFDAVFVPGGFGAAKNFCDFGFKGPEMSVEADVQSVLKEFHSAKKVIGMSCIAPIIAAKAFGDVKLTLGKASGDSWPFAGSIEAA